MKHTVFVLLSLALLLGVAFGQTETQAEPSLDATMWQVGGLLAGGIVEVSTPELAENFQTLRIALEASGGDTLRVAGLAVNDVETALSAEPFDQAALIDALESLALELRTAAEAGDVGLQVELASLIDQTAAFIEDEGYTPRLEVEVP